MWAVVKNPFSLSTNNPKIPDGRAALSAGQKYQVINELPCGSNGEMTLVLYPGLGSGLSVFTLEDLTGTEFSYQNHGDINFAGGAPAAGATNDYQTDEDNIAMWRLVSQGANLSLTNNMEENDGWFESVRLTTSRNPKDWTLASAPVGTGYNCVPCAPNGDIDALFGVDRATWIEHPTYTTGKLKEIHRMPFVLQHEANDYEFRRILNAGRLTLGADACLEDNAVSRQFLHDRVDDTFDIIMIRIHGRTDTNSTRILCHLCTNQEIVYENGTTLARFHTESVKSRRSY